jgi:O-antigen/teichoic acid export membrane protein
MNSTWKQILETSGARALALMISLASLSVTARVLGPEGRGIIAGATTWINLLVALGSLSVGQVLINRAASSRDLSWVSSAFGAGLVLTCGLSGIIWVGALAAGYFVGDMYGQLPGWALVVVFASLPFAMWERFGSQLLICTGHLKFFNQRLVVASLLGFFALMLVLVLLDWGVAGGLVVTVLSTALVSAVGIQRLWEMSGKCFIVRSAELFTFVKDGLKLHLHTVGGTLLPLSGILLVNYYGNANEVGWYQLAVQMVTTLMIVPQAAWIVLNEKIAGKGPDRVWPLQRKLLVQTIGLMMLIMAFSYVAAPYAVLFIAGESFSPSVDLFRIMLPSVLGMSLSYFMGTQWLGRGLFGQTALLTGLLGAINLILNLVYIPKFGVSAAAWSMTIVYTVMVFTNLGMAVYVERQWRKRRFLLEVAV